MKFEMKKFLLFLVCIFAFSPAFAQLNVSSQQVKIEKIGTLRSTYAFVYNQGTAYFLSIRSSNQFDNNCLFCLGKTAESSILTAQDLVGLCDSLEANASVTAKDAQGVNALFVKKKMLGKPYLDISMDGQAGTSNITKPELEKAIDIIKEHAGITE